MKDYKIFAINPGSTSTKIALYESGEIVYTKGVQHDIAEIRSFVNVNDQLEYRETIILSELEKDGISLDHTDVFVGRGGGIQTLAGGTYLVNDLMLEHARVGLISEHPSNLGCQLADKLARQLGALVYMVNGPTTDEFQEVARITGLKGIYRKSIIHALNQKEVGIRYAAVVGKAYSDLNLVIAHIGGGISITTHRKGQMVDSNDILNGDGPMTPNRSGELPAVAVLRMCFSGKYTEDEIYKKITSRGGILDHLGTDDVKEVSRRAREDHDEEAKLIYDAMIYQIGKNIGAYAAVLHGDVDAIILTGGISRDKYATDKIIEMVGRIAPVAVMAGEFEMEAMISGALRVLKGEEKVKEYTGIPVWNSGSDYALRI